MRDNRLLVFLIGIFGLLLDLGLYAIGFWGFYVILIAIVSLFLCWEACVCDTGRPSP